MKLSMATSFLAHPSLLGDLSMPFVSQVEIKIKTKIKGKIHLKNSMWCEAVEQTNILMPVPFNLTPFSTLFFVNCHSMKKISNREKTQ